MVSFAEVNIFSYEAMRILAFDLDLKECVSFSSPLAAEVAGSDALDQLMLDAQRANDSSHEATPLSDDTTASEHAAAMGVTSREHGSLTSPEHGSTGDGSVGSPEPGSESGLSLQLTESNSVKSGQVNIR